MGSATVSLKKWGSSLGVVIPAELVEEEKLEEKEKVIIEVKKISTLSDVFGSLKEWKADAQKLKDEARRGW
ncbi:AbrB/MazE/SpoVT family DNA-binding domain-containing protein [Candidatus Micrarchaeota archaeon]|nr:AbrB/MazE/SpoVT family DNA-binding domain-containing protein [Candidatus Micrarchaeota archaeon]